MHRYTGTAIFNIAIALTQRGVKPSPLILEKNGTLTSTQKVIQLFTLVTVQLVVFSSNKQIILAIGFLHQIAEF